MKASHGIGSKDRQVGIGGALVVARDDDAEPVLLDRDLGRAEHMAGRIKGDVDVTDTNPLPKHRRLTAHAEVRPVAQSHDVERLGRRHHHLVTGAGMIAVAVSDERAGHRPHGVDMKIAGGAVKASRR